MRSSIAAAFRRILATAVLLATTSATAGEQAPATTSPAAEIIGADRIRAYMAVLADDDMEGRETGTRGFNRAARYVASEFERLGLEPLSKGYMQNLLLRRARVDEARSSLSIDLGGTRDALVYGDDFVTYGSTSAADVSVSGEVLFVGDGVTTPNRRIDAYRGLDVRGKIVIALPGAPASLRPSEKSLFDDVKGKAENAASHGAAAFIIVDDVPWALRVRAAHQLGSTAWLPQRTPRTVKAVLYLSGPAAARLFGKRVDRTTGQVGAVLGTASLRVRNDLREVKSANVSALLRGSDARLSREYIVVTAHLDHVGIGEPIRGDAIYNGAVDNASGVAALLTIAKSFSALPMRPARSMIFVATTGEEQGEVGSDYFVHHPPVPLEQIVANLNIDGISFTGFEEVEVGGGADSLLGAHAQSAAERLGLRAKNTYIGLGGSDHSPFLEMGVPALWIGAALSDDWMNTRYHTPQDDMTQPLEFAPAVRYTQFVFETACLIAQAPQRPRWNASVVWGQRRGR
jgi:hypothetical protein